MNYFLCACALPCSQPLCSSDKAAALPLFAFLTKQLLHRYLGGYFQRTTTDLEFPFLSCDHAIAIRLRYTSRLRQDSEAYVQFATLYSTPEGLRRIR